MPFASNKKNKPRVIVSSEVRGWLFNLPALIVLFIFYLGPAIIGLYFSLHKWDGSSPEIVFVGLENFIQILKEPRFWNSVKINILAAAISLVGLVTVAFGLALILSKRGMGMRFFRAVYYLPQIFSLSAVGLIWRMLFHPYRGFINLFIQRIGFAGFNFGWLGNPETALLSVLATTVWYYFGFHMLYYIAGLGAIPTEYYDAIKLESNRLFYELRYVTLPLLREQFLVTFILTMSGSFGHLIGLFIILTNGGPAGRTELMGIYMIEMAFRAFKFGEASALSVLIILIVLLLVIYPIRRITRERLEY